jgi:hypothetical protein
MTLAPGEQLVIKAMQNGEQLLAVFIVTPAFAKLLNGEQEDVVALGDVLNLETLGLIRRVDRGDSTVEFFLTESGSIWPDEVMGSPVISTNYPATFWNKYGTEIVIIGVLLLIVLKWVLGF